MWQRLSVIDQFPPILCFRVNRFLFDKTTYSITKNTTPITLEDIIQVSNCENAMIEYAM